MKYIGGKGFQLSGTLNGGGIDITYTVVDATVCGAIKQALEPVPKPLNYNI